MGIFDKVEQDAEDMMRDDPKLAQQAGQLGGQLGWDMQAARNMIGKQRGAPEQEQGQDQDGSDGSDGSGQEQDEGQRQGH
jgi:hypothetical protein